MYLLEIGGVDGASTREVTEDEEKLFSPGEPGEMGLGECTGEPQGEEIVSKGNPVPSLPSCTRGAE